MRVAVLSRSNRVVGGIEDYLQRFLIAAAGSGHDVGFWYETTDGPPERPTIQDPPGRGWPIAELGRAAAMAALRRWRPDVIYAHGVASPELEEEAYGIAPAVFFAHVYVGTCITGGKTTWFPVAKPCDRPFGPACLAHYFPRRCGGLNPQTMLQQYRVQSRRLAIIRKCAAVVTHSTHMRDEYIRNGIPADRVFSFPFYVVESVSDELPARPLARCPTLMFIGRMEMAKGGDLLLDALPLVRAALDCPLRALFVGDGRQRPGGGARPATLQARDAGLQFEFTGWVEDRRRTALFQESDLLVVPSIWPEPFGQVGPEAGLYGLPVAAFAVGGIPGWLTDGVNGSLAPGDPPTAGGLAEAIVRCLADPTVHERLRIGAARLAGRFTWDNHFSPLIAVLTQVARQGG
jgi:glycosyltransferase involved in cell wall biosynthesis